MNNKIEDRSNRYIYLLIVFSIVFDCLVYLFEKETGFSLIRGLMFYMFIFYYYFRFKNVPNQFVHFWIICLIFYWFLLIFFSSEMGRTVNFYTKTIIPFFIFIISMKSNASVFSFLYIKKAFVLVILVSVLFALLANVFNVGDESYTRNVDDFIRVGLGDGKLYAASISLLIFPFYLSYFEITGKQKKIILLLSVVCIIYLILSVRRTTLAVSIIGVFIYYFKTGELKRFVGIIFYSILLLSITSPLWIDLFTSRMQLRDEKFEQEYDVTEETRFKEFEIVISEAYNSPNANIIIFGKELFNSPGNYANGYYANRMLHVDFTRIIHGSGFFGLLLYLLIYISMFIYYRKIKKININGFSLTHIKMFDGLFYSFFFVSLFISLSGQMYEITFRSMIFWVLGIVLNVVGNAK